MCQPRKSRPDPRVALEERHGSIKLFTYAGRKIFYRAGSLGSPRTKRGETTAVFGGGHVVLPLLQAEVVPPGCVTNDALLAGYGAAQAVPGPLFTFAAYLGTVMGPEPNGWLGAALCLVGIFLPALARDRYATVLGYTAKPAHRTGGLKGVNAVVVGLLLAALYNPAWTTGITHPGNFALAVVCFLFLLHVAGAAVVGGDFERRRRGPSCGAVTTNTFGLAPGAVSTTMIVSRLPSSERCNRWLPLDD